MKLEWFTTIPGILIASGVVLLVLAIILFIIGNKKAKKEAKQAVQNLVEEQKNEEAIPVEVATEAPVEEVQPVVETPVVEEPKNEEVVPVEVNTETPVEEVQPVVEENNTVDFNITEPVVEEPKNEEVAPVEVDTETPVEEVQPAVETPVVEPTPVINIETPNVEEQPAYGGVEPSETITVEEEKPATIYGGADPLEKTQNFPTVEENHEPYGGTPEVKIVEPTFEQPQAEPITIETPEPIKIEEPEQL